MARFVGLSTAVILALLAIQAEPITAILGLLWTLLHLYGVVMSWYGNSSEDIR